MAAASISETRQAIDTALRARGAPFTEYSCKTISWDDVSRGTVAGALSCWGSNITDTYLKAKDGTSLFTVRPDNWNEKLGVVRATDVALLIGNCDASSQNPPPQLRNVTLQQFLRSPATCGAAYTSISPDVALDAPEKDDHVSIRFQTVFLPVRSSDDNTRQTFEFATEAYNYNTTSDDDPRNLILLATTQGLAVQADGAGAKRLLHHVRDSLGRNIWQHWLEAERSDHAVGGPQVESAEEISDAKHRQKATAEILGIKAMGTRFNTLMTIQVPLVKHRTSTEQGFGMPLDAGIACYSFDSSPDKLFALKKARKCMLSTGAARGASRGRRIGTGSSNAARVSRGTRHSVYPGLTVKKPRRNFDEHVTVTVVFYNTVAGGVPSADDVIAAVDDMEKLLLACTKSGRLADAAFDFMKAELTVSDVIEIADKLTNQPRGLPPTN